MQRVTAPNVMQLDGKGLPLWTYEHLSQVEKKNLSTKALDLRERIKAVPQLHAKYATTLRTAGESILTIRWVLEVQADLLTARGRSEVFRSQSIQVSRSGRESFSQKVRPGDAPDAAQMPLLPYGPRKLAAPMSTPLFPPSGVWAPDKHSGFWPPCRCDG
jgi:hypothetical protein|tara:strand:+ start:825 stop:1304 length:480 start_codon:yes stop_codon:yes gene_type:complete